MKSPGSKENIEAFIEAGIAAGDINHDELVEFYFTLVCVSLKEVSYLSNADVGVFDQYQ